MNSVLGLAVMLFSLLSTARSPAHATTVAEVAAKIKSLKAQERIAYVLKGAQAERELA